jgi:hypothetical protein
LEPILKFTASLATAALIAVLPAVASAQKLGDHPAIVVQRLKATQGYDYQNTFYPHPAGLYLSSEAPHTMSDHPAVIVFKREQQLHAQADAADPAMCRSSNASAGAEKMAPAISSAKGNTSKTVDTASYPSSGSGS